MVWETKHRTKIRVMKRFTQPSRYSLFLDALAGTPVDAVPVNPGFGSLENKKRPLTKHNQPEGFV